MIILKQKTPLMRTGIRGGFYQLAVPLSFITQKPIRSRTHFRDFDTIQALSQRPRLSAD